jgi:hypothetical protein
MQEKSIYLLVELLVDGSERIGGLTTVRAVEFHGLGE